MRFAVIIVGLAGGERYLVERHETTELRRADRFKTERAAIAAAEQYVATYPPVIARGLQFRVEPIQRGAA